MSDYYHSLEQPAQPIRWLGFKTLALFLLLGLAPLTGFTLFLRFGPDRGAAAPGVGPLAAAMALTALCGLALAMVARHRLAATLEALAASLRESDQRLRAVGNNIPGSAIFQLSRDGQSGQRFLYISAGVTDILGLPPEAFLRRAETLFECALDTDRAQLVDLMDQSWQAMTVLNFEGRFRGAWSSDRWVRLCAVPRSLDGERVVWDGLILDITERTLAERALRESERRYRDLIETNPHGILEIDLDGRIVFCNTAHRRIYGQGNQEILGRSVFDLPISAQDRELTRLLLPALLREQPPIDTIITPHTLRDGRRIWAQIDWIYKRNDRGDVEGFISVITDTTRRKEAEIALRRQAGDLARSNEDLRQFAYVASHDLQEPLRSIAGYIQLIERRHGAALDNGARRYIAKSVEAAKRMQLMIQNLMEYSRVSARSRPFEDIDSADLLRAVQDNLSVSIQQAEARIVCRDTPQIRGDATQLTRVLQNLIANSLKFRSSEPPVIEIAITAIDKGREDLPEKARMRGWLFAVCDNGIGIEPEDSEKIFQIFQRLHAQKDFPGAGIGLAICKKIVERHGGRIWVDSTPGKGATFYFTIAEQTQDAGPSPLASPVKGDGADGPGDNRETPS